MQSKHLWYIIDISWQELDKKLQVLASTELTCEQLWQHLFLTKHRPFVEGRYKGVDYKEVEKKWEATKKYFQDCKRFTRLFSVNLFFFFALCCLGKIPGGAPFSQLHKGGKQRRVDRP